MRRWIFSGMMACMACFLLTGCDKLDDSDGDIMKEVLPGKWSFSYLFKDDADPGLELQYKFVLFNEDGTCALTYDDGALNGTYQATSAMIRVVSSDIGNQEQIIIWRIISLSSKQIIAEYSFDYHYQSFTVVVTLDKQG
jgi:hypothetical protein